MPSQKHEKLLKEIRDNYAYALGKWAKIRQESAVDRRYIAGDPWPAQEKANRQALGYERPCLVFDELNQYVNQVINDARQNKRAVKVTPRGDGANDKTAEFRQNLIREIEYKSNAQAAYLSAFSGAVEGSYGYARLVKCYCDPNSFDQELKIERIPNPDTVVLDPDFVQADASDIKFAFIIDTVRREEFKRRFPNADITSFSPEHQLAAPQWIQDDSVQIAEYWKLKIFKRKLLAVEMLVGDVVQQTTVFLDELEGATLVKAPEGTYIYQGGEPTSMRVVNQRDVEDRSVVQYLTNGIEILEETPWEGKYIPIGACFGKEEYADFGNGTERIFKSLVRLARDPYMALCYTRTSEMEIAGMMPKTPFLGAEGQFENHEDEFQQAAKIPRAFLEYKPTTPATGDVVLGPPQRPNSQADLSSLELYAESCRRAIQAAMGINNLPTDAQRINQKSGIALQKIASQQAQGSYHFIDNYDRFLAHFGRMIDDIIPHVYDTQGRVVGVRKDDETHELVKINEPYEDNGEQKEYRTDCGTHGVTISTGPSYLDQRDRANEFAQSLVTPDLMGLAIAGNPKAAKITSLAIKLQDGGPIMDHIANVLDPESEQGAPEQMRMQLQQAQAQLQQAAQIIQQLQPLADKGQLELQKAQLDAEVTLRKTAEDNATKIKVAEIQANAKLADTSLSETAESQREAFRAAHDANKTELETRVGATVREHEAAERDKDRQQAETKE